MDFLGADRVGSAWQGPPVGKMGPGRLGIFIMRRWPRIAVCGLLGPIVWGALAKGNSARIAKAVGGEVREAGNFYHEKVA